jgi:hypothetical protein
LGFEEDWRLAAFATLKLVKEVAAFLGRARHDPGLRFGGE